MGWETCLPTGGALASWKAPSTFKLQNFCLTSVCLRGRGGGADKLISSAKHSDPACVTCGSSSCPMGITAQIPQETPASCAICDPLSCNSVSLQSPQSLTCDADFLRSARTHASVSPSISRDRRLRLVSGARVCTSRNTSGAAWQLLQPLTFQDKWPSTVYTGFGIHSCFHFMLCLRFHQCHVIFTFSQIELFYFLLLHYCYITEIVWALLKEQRFKVLKDSST